MTVETVSVGRKGLVEMCTERRSQEERMGWQQDT